MIGARLEDDAGNVKACPSAPCPQRTFGPQTEKGRCSDARPFGSFQLAAFRAWRDHALNTCCGTCLLAPEVRRRALVGQPAPGARTLCSPLQRVNRVFPPQRSLALESTGNSSTSPSAMISTANAARISPISRVMMLMPVCPSSRLMRPDAAKASSTARATTTP